MDLEFVRIRKDVFNFLSPKSYAVKDAYSSTVACRFSVALRHTNLNGRFVNGIFTNY